MEYFTRRVCAKCGHEDVIETFKEKRKLSSVSVDCKVPCSKCNSYEVYSVSYSEWKLDQSLLDLWGQHAEFNFHNSDKIFLTDLDSATIFIDNLENTNYLEDKKEQLLQVLCDLIYDYTSGKKVALKEHDVLMLNRIRLHLKMHKQKVMRLEMEESIKSMISLLLA
ncbi:MAG: hypothetical protein AAFO07_29920 [Bacteroidota bacterium]